MRLSSNILLAISIIIPSSGAARAADKADPKAIVKAALAAHGGTEKLNKAKAMTWSEKGTYYGMGDGLPYTGKYAAQYPDRYRMEIEGFFTMVVDGKKGFTIMGGAATDMTSDQLEEQRESMHASSLATLVPLSEKEYTLTSLGESKVGEQTVEGIKAASKGHRDVELYFDKTTHMLAKIAFKAKPAELQGKEVTQETVMSEYKDVDGVKMQTKIQVNLDGKKYVEAEMTDLKTSDKLDDKLFAKP